MFLLLALFAIAVAVVFMYALVVSGGWWGFLCVVIGLVGVWISFKVDKNTVYSVPEEK